MVRYLKCLKCNTCKFVRPRKYISDAEYERSEKLKDLIAIVYVASIPIIVWTVFRFGSPLNKIEDT